MVIVQMSVSEDEKKVQDIKTSSLKPYQASTQGYYVTAYFKVNSSTPSTFEIGDRKKYEYNGKSYINKPLEPNSTYVVFLRCFESKVNNSQTLNLYLKQNFGLKSYL